MVESPHQKQAYLEQNKDPFQEKKRKKSASTKVKSLKQNGQKFTSTFENALSLQKWCRIKFFWETYFHKHHKMN